MRAGALALRPDYAEAYSQRAFTLSARSPPRIWVPRSFSKCRRHWWACFGQAQWPVDVRTDLCVVLEQLPRLLRAVKSGSPAVLDFYEQSIRRRLTFTPLREDYEVTCVPFSPYWEPSPATGRIGRVALERMLAAVLDEFMNFLRRVAPELERHAWIRAWLA